MKFGMCQQMQNMSPPLPATARSQHRGDGQMGGRKEGMEGGGITGLLMLPCQCQTVLDVCPEQGAAKQGSCTFSDLTFYELHWVSTASRHWSEYFDRH